MEKTVSSQQVGRSSNLIRRDSRFSGTASVRSRGTWVVYVLTIALYALIFSWWQAEPVPWEVHVVGIIVAGLCLFPMAYWSAHGSRGLPMFELICIAYLLAFGIPLYLQPNRVYNVYNLAPFAWEQTFQTLLLVVLGIGSMIAGYYIGQKGQQRLPLPRLDLPLHPRRSGLYLGGAVFIGGTIIFCQAVGVALPGGGSAAFVRLLSGQLYIAIILLSYRLYECKATPKEKALLGFAVCAASLYGLSVGVLESVLVPLVLLFIVRWHMTRKLPVNWLVAGLILFLTLNSVKGAYRAQAWDEENSLSARQRIELWLDLTQRQVASTISGESTGGGESTDVSTTFYGSMRRFDLLHQFVHVQQMTPTFLPYFDGETYAYFIYGWIPRFVWPDKPVASEANDTLATSYGFLAENQLGAVSIGIGHLPEAYANFGMGGTIIAMGLQGIFFSLVNAVMNGPQSVGGRAIYISIMIYFLNGIGSQTAPMFSAIVPGIVGGILILRPFATGWSAVKGKQGTTGPRGTTPFGEELNGATRLRKGRSRAWGRL